MKGLFLKIYKGISFSKKDTNRPDKTALYFDRNYMKLSSDFDVKLTPKKGGRFTMRNFLLFVFVTFHLVLIFLASSHILD